MKYILLTLILFIIILGCDDTASTQVNKNKNEIVKKQNLIKAKTLFLEATNLVFKKTEVALDMLNTSIKLAPDYAPPYLTIGMIYRNRLNESEKATEYFKKYLELKPEYKKAKLIKKWISESTKN